MSICSYLTYHAYHISMSVNTHHGWYSWLTKDRNYGSSSWNRTTKTHYTCVCLFLIGDELKKTQLEVLFSWMTIVHPKVHILCIYIYMGIVVHLLRMVSWNLNTMRQTEVNDTLSQSSENMTCLIPRTSKTRWWFQICFIFTPREDSQIWRAYFANGLVQPPTSNTYPIYGCLQK